LKTARQLPHTKLRIGYNGFPSKNVPETAADSSPPDWLGC